MSANKRTFITIEKSSNNQKYVSIFEVEDEKDLTIMLFDEYTPEQVLSGAIEIIEITDSPRLNLVLQIKPK